MASTVQTKILVGLLLLVGMPAMGKEQRPTRTDRNGDSLSPRAVARLGTVRFRHAGSVYEAAFTADGKLLAATSGDWTKVIIWDRATGRMHREIPTPSRTELQPGHLRFSADGKRLYSCYWDGMNRVMMFHAWDVATGAAAQSVPPLPAKTRALGYSPDGREILLIHKEAELVRWDIEKGVERGRYPKPGDDVRLLALVGERLLVPQVGDQSVGVWDAARKKRLWEVKAVTRERNAWLPMAFSADGQLFAVETSPRVISVHRSLTGERILRIKSDVKENFFSLSISPDGRTVAGSNRDGTLRLWDVPSGRERVKIPDIQGWTTDVFFASNSKVFATGGGNNPHAVLLWDAATGKRIDSAPGHNSNIRSVSFSPDGRTAATSSSFRDDPIVRLWDAQTGRLLRSLDTKSAGIFAVAFSPDGATLAISGWHGNNKVWLWDVRAGRGRHVLAGHEMTCICVAFSPDGKRLASGDDYINNMGHYEGRLCIWDVESGKRLHEIRGTPGIIDRVLFTRDGQHILAAADGVFVYNAHTRQRVGEPFQTKCRIASLALSADGRLLATASGNCGPVRLWELATRREIPIAIPNGNGYFVDITPDGRILATNGKGGGFVLFHWPSGETIARLPDEGDEGSGIFFSPDGSRLATASRSESSALIWDVAKLVNRPLPAVAKPSKEDLLRWWADLRDENPGTAYRAVWRFVASSEQTLPFLAESLRPIKPLAADAVARLIADLDDSEFPVRQKASRELERLGDTVENALRKPRKGNISVEQARRIDELLAKLSGPEQWRAGRALAVLEQIGGPQARKILEGLAAGTAEARLTCEAKAALDRLAHRSDLRP